MSYSRLVPVEYWCVRRVVFSIRMGSVMLLFGVVESAPSLGIRILWDESRGAQLYTSQAKVCQHQALLRMLSSLCR